MTAYSRVAKPDTQLFMTSSTSINEDLDDDTLSRLEKSRADIASERQSHLDLNFQLDSIKESEELEVNENDTTFVTEEEIRDLTCKQKMRFFIKQSIKDIKRNKCQFCLSFCSVCVVVLSILVVVSITSLGPIIFFSLG